MNLNLESNVVIPSGPRTVREAAETHATLLAALREPGDVMLDCSAVTDTDLSFIQMILAARRSAAAAGRRLTLCPPPDGKLHEALVRGGFVGAEAADPAQWCDEWCDGGDLQKDKQL